jgi:hypothetical protein
VQQRNGSHAWCAHRGRWASALELYELTGKNIRAACNLQSLETESE